MFVEPGLARTMRPLSGSYLVRFMMVLYTCHPCGMSFIEHCYEKGYGDTVEIKVRLPCSQVSTKKSPPVWEAFHYVVRVESRLVVLNAQCDCTSVVTCLSCNCEDARVATCSFKQNYIARSQLSSFSS